MQWQVEPCGWTVESCCVTQVYASVGCGLVPPGVDVCTASYIDGGGFQVLRLGWNFQDSIWYLRSLPIIRYLFYQLGWAGKILVIQGPTIFSHPEMGLPSVFHLASCTLQFPPILPSLFHILQEIKNVCCLDLRTGAEWPIASCSEEEYVLGTFESVIRLEQSKQVRNWGWMDYVELCN